MPTIHEHIKKLLFNYRKQTLLADTAVLDLWLGTIDFLAKQQQIMQSKHYYWVDASDRSAEYSYDLLIAKNSLLKRLGGFSRHFMQPEHIAHFEAAFLRKYTSSGEKRTPSYLHTYCPISKKTKAFVGYRVSDYQVDAHLAEAFAHPLRYKYDEVAFFSQKMS